MEQGAATCALEMAKAKAISEAKKALRGNFLEGLLAGTLSSAEIERLSTRLDHNTAKPHVVLTYIWDGVLTPLLSDGWKRRSTHYPIEITPVGACLWRAISVCFKLCAKMIWS